MDEEKYRVFMAVAAVATTLTFLAKFGPDVPAMGAVWSAATAHPWLALGLTATVAAGVTWSVVKWLDER